MTWFQPVGRGAPGGKLQLYGVQSTTPDADPSSLHVATRDAGNGWIEVDYDDDPAAGDVPSEMIAYDLGAPRDLLGQAVDLNAGNFSLILEHDDYPPTGLYAGLVIAPNSTFASNVHAGLMVIGVTSSLMTYRTWRDNTQDVAQVLNVAALHARWTPLAFSSDRGAIRGQSIHASTPAGVFVNAGSSFATAADFQPSGSSLWLIVGHSGAAAAGGGTQTYRVRPGLYANADTAYVLG